ncbi:uncharacterized protein J4E92_009720 [Alternaria infectoria]|uniref:uncharacterized protein n=1 Tax=Alternaria infectoria TaxID=45303 RepID=UPI00221F5424|nr:uncharacterized protein J4E92_009720 [Alternaria infectoria]KAI4914306.1 hypothetical protein J4E92_009720 [Alternaria infectoria]
MWLSGTTIDFLVERCGNSRGYSPEVVYVATSRPVYMATIGTSSSNPEIRPDIASLIPQSVFILPELDAAAFIVFTWNPTNSHWVVVQALCMEFGAGLMRVYDTGRRYRSTSMFEQELRQFVALVALSHPRSRLANVDWNTVAVRYEETVQQEADDCGVFTAWNVRTLLHNDQPAKSASNALSVGMTLRRELFTGAHSTISGRDPPYCSSQAALDAHIEHLSGDMRNPTGLSPTSNHHNDDKKPGVSTLGPVRYVARTRPTELATSHPTIVSYTDLGEPRQYEHCASAVQEIAQYILSNNIDASIEAIDRVVGESFTVTALQGPTAAEIARYWASKRRTLLRTIANRKWLSLDCVNLGKSTDGLKPTIVITASDADADVWDQIIARISVLFDYKLEVELLYGPRSRIDLADAVGDTEEAEMSDISTKVEEEADFASKELKKPKSIANESEDEEFCRPSHFSTNIYPSTSVEVKRGLLGSRGNKKLVQPPYLREASCGSVTVVVPLDRDKTRYVRRRKLIINKHNRYLRDASSKHQAVESESHRSKRQQWREEREEERKERKRVEEASNVAGTTWASSSKTSRPHPRYTAKQHENWTEHSRSTNDTTEGPALEWDIDWSLFSIDAPRLAVSKTPRSTDHRHSASDSEISEWGSIQEDRSYEVVKIGRTSGSLSAYLTLLRFDIILRSMTSTSRTSLSVAKPSPFSNTRRRTFHTNPYQISVVANKKLSCDVLPGATFLRSAMQPSK